jgi:uncharacterized protein YbaP (TraB family)
MHARHRAAWRCLLLLASLMAVTSLHAAQQAPIGKDPVQVEPAQQDAPAKPPVSTRGISAQAASEAAAAQLEPAAADAHDGKDLQVARDATQPAPVLPDAATVPGEPAPASAADAASSMPATAGATRGVLFRIFPPVPTALPAELAVAGNMAVQATDPEAGSRAAAAVAAPPPVQAAPEPPRPSYLLGTIHFGSPEEQGVDYAILEKALAAVDTFVNEADLDETWKPAYDDYRWLSPAQPLSGMLSKDSYAMARSLLPNVRAQDMPRMKPWAVLALLEARGETGSDTTMDARLQRIAAAAGKRLVHLETLEQQLQALDCVPAAEHALVLDERLRAPWILRDESAAAMNYYRARNLDAWLADIDHMYGLSYAGKAIEQRSRQCLLEARNARWIGQLETLFQDGPSFVAVGAVHLVGPAGLLAALRHDGYRIEEVPL